MTNELITRTTIDGNEALTFKPKEIADAGLDIYLTQPSDFEEFSDSVEQCYEVPTERSCLDEVTFVPVAFCNSPREYVERVDEATDDSEEWNYNGKDYNVPDEDAIR